MDNTEALMNFGLTRQEARVYVLLLTEGALSGYEAAKRIGISRSNAYAALAGLVEKGAAYVAEEQAVRYQAVPVKEFCANKMRYFGELADCLEQQIPRTVHKDENYLTIRGRRHIEDKFRNMLKETKARVYLSVSVPVIDQFREELSALIREGKKVVLLTREPYELPGAIIYTAADGSAGKRTGAGGKTGSGGRSGSGAEKKTEAGNQLRLITDSSYALVGELSKEAEPTCLYSANPNLAGLLKDALANEIALIRLKERT